MYSELIKEDKDNLYLVLTLLRLETSLKRREQTNVEFHRMFCAIYGLLNISMDSGS